MNGTFGPNAPLSIELRGKKENKQQRFLSAKKKKKSKSIALKTHVSLFPVGLVAVPAYPPCPLMGEPNLTGDVPLARPTSAPPILEISRGSLFAFTDTRADLNRIFTDIRCDENYPSFYEDFQQANGDTVAVLPPPLEAPIIPSGAARPPVGEQVQPTPQRLSAQGFLPAWTPFQVRSRFLFFPWPFR